jgi:hypothetical protein
MPIPKFLNRKHINPTANTILLCPIIIGEMPVQQCHFSQPRITLEQPQSDAMLPPYLKVYLTERLPLLPRCLQRSPQRIALPDHPRSRGRRLGGGGCVASTSAAELVVGEDPVLEHEPPRPPPLPVVHPLVQHPRDRRRLRLRGEDARGLVRLAVQLVRGVVERHWRDAA